MNHSQRVGNRTNHREHEGIHGRCKKCERAGLVLKWRGQLVCRDCLYADEEPLDIADFAYGPSNFVRGMVYAPGISGWPTNHPYPSEIKAAKEAASARKREQMRNWWRKNRGKEAEPIPAENIS